MKYIDRQKYKNSESYRYSIMGRILTLGMIDGMDGLTKEQLEELDEIKNFSLKKEE